MDLPTFFLTVGIVANTVAGVAIMRFALATHRQLQGVAEQLDKLMAVVLLDRPASFTIRDHEPAHHR